MPYHHAGWMHVEMLPWRVESSLPCLSHPLCLNWLNPSRVVARGRDWAAPGELVLNRSCLNHAGPRFSSSLVFCLSFAAFLLFLDFFFFFFLWLELVELLELQLSERSACWLLLAAAFFTSLSLHNFTNFKLFCYVFLQYNKIIRILLDLKKKRQKILEKSTSVKLFEKLVNHHGCSGTRYRTHSINQTTLPITRERKTDKISFTQIFIS